MELDLLKNLSSIEKNLEKVKTFAPERSKSLKKRLNSTTSLGYQTNIGSHRQNILDTNTMSFKA